MRRFDLTDWPEQQFAEKKIGQFETQLTRQDDEARKRAHGQYFGPRLFSGL